LNGYPLLIYIFVWMSMSSTAKENQTIVTSNLKNESLNFVSPKFSKRVHQQIGFIHPIYHPIHFYFAWLLIIMISFNL